MAASEKALAGLSFYIEPMVKPAKPDAKTKDLFRCEKFFFLDENVTSMFRVVLEGVFGY
jgi:hypothetical protein